MLLPYIVSLFSLAYGHGILEEPPGRSSMWRFGFPDSPKNYDDNALFCGGYTTQHEKNNGKCGICGDDWSKPKPRANEAGGTYGQGIIVRKYNVGQTINIIVELTANHLGFFEFKLCSNNNITSDKEQECFDENPLSISSLSIQGCNNSFKCNIGSSLGKIKFQAKLPFNLYCQQCILQWTWTAGNNWGICPNGEGKQGCGPQETYRACADVAIYK